MKRYALPILWMGSIFLFSTDLGSMGNTSQFLVPLIRFLFPAFSQNELSLALTIVRKLAHLFEYAVLSILWYSVFIQGGGKFIGHPATMALLISIAYAGLDEVHHSFVRSRTGSMVDVGIDSIGAIGGLTVLKGVKFLSVPSIKIKARYFGWWFAWGGFSTIMILIVIQGANLMFWQMLLMVLGGGIAAGLGGIVYYGRRR